MLFSFSSFTINESENAASTLLIDLNPPMLRVKADMNPLLTNNWVDSSKSTRARRLKKQQLWSVCYKKILLNYKNR
jgi:hypothetical protein